MMMMIVYWYSFSNHYTRECIHTCKRERTCGSSQSSPGFVLAPSSWCRHASHAHHLPSPPCLVSPKRGLACSATFHHTPVGPSVCTEAGCRLTLFTPGPGPSRLSLLVITKIKPLRQCLLNCRDTYTGTQAKQGTRASTTRQGGSHGAP